MHLYLTQGKLVKAKVKKKKTKKLIDTKVSFAKHPNVKNWGETVLSNLSLKSEVYNRIQWCFRTSKEKLLFQQFGSSLNAFPVVLQAMSVMVWVFTFVNEVVSSQLCFQFLHGLKSYVVKTSFLKYTWGSSVFAFICCHRERSQNQMRNKHLTGTSCLLL